MIKILLNIDIIIRKIDLLAFKKHVISKQIKLYYIIPSSAKLKYPWFGVRIKWSRSLISNNSDACLILEVNLLSASLGFKFPEGWLWAKIIAVESDFKTTANMILISTNVPVTVAFSM